MMFLNKEAANEIILSRFEEADSLNKRIVDATVLFTTYSCVERNATKLGFYSWTIVYYF